MPVVSSPLHLFAKPLLYTKLGMVSNLREPQEQVTLECLPFVSAAESTIISSLAIPTPRSAQSSSPDCKNRDMILLSTEHAALAATAALQDGEASLSPGKRPSSPHTYSRLCTLLYLDHFLTLICHEQAHSCASIQTEIRLQGKRSRTSQYLCLPGSSSNGPLHLSRPETRRQRIRIRHEFLQHASRHSSNDRRRE